MAKILIVEDESAIAELVAINLRHAGHEVTVAADARQAQIAIDAVLPDLVVPATLTAAAASAVARGAEHFPSDPDRILVTGGGRHNRTLMRMLASQFAVPVLPVEEVGLDGDMLEAQAFAYLAVRVARGLPTSCPTTTGVAAAVGGGRISQPQAAA